MASWLSHLTGTGGKAKHAHVSKKKRISEGGEASFFWMAGAADDQAAASPHAQTTKHHPPHSPSLSPPPAYPGRTTMPSMTSSSSFTLPSAASGSPPPFSLLQKCSLSLNPSFQLPPHRPDELAGLLGKLGAMEAKLQQPPTYDPCFEVEVIAQAKQDRQVQVPPPQRGESAAAVGSTPQATRTGRGRVNPSA